LIVDWRKEKIMAAFSMEETEHISLCETLDRILNKGAVIIGELTISVANVDLIYIALQVMIGSVETVRGEITRSGSGTAPIRIGIRADNVGKLKIKD
jgi:hypothetical protein